MLSRRSLLASAAGGVVAASTLAACSSTQIAQAQQEWASVVSKIQQTVAAAAKYIPTVESIAATAAGLFGPSYSTLVQVGSAFFNQIVQTLVNVVNNLTPPAAAQLRARLRASTALVPVTVGATVVTNTSTGQSTSVVVTGFHI